MSHNNDEEEEDYFLPLEDQRVFGAGIRRKRVPFVRSSEHELNTTTSTATASSSSTPTGPNIANTYLSIVLSKTAPGETQSAPPSPSAIPVNTNATATSNCEVCNLPISISTESQSQSQETTATANTTTQPHEATLAHQLCLTHSHPPSHLDRTRPGLRYLSSFGWDPDSRLGLGAPGREGIREPIKGKLKVDTVGLGVERDRRDREEGGNMKKTKTKTKGNVDEGKVQKLNAKQVRKGAVEERKKGERLREMFFRGDDVMRYLDGL